MQPTNLNKIQASFSKQAVNFENKDMNFSKQEYLEYTISSINAKSTDYVLEVAAGTCVCGRALAQAVNKIICLDATQEMLEAGKRAATLEAIKNMEFVNGYAESLPFDDCTFDIVMTRLSFHHFTEIQAPFNEMYRVLKPKGKLVIIDMEATDEALRETEDKIETMRDYSHVKNRSQQELLSLYENKNCSILKCESTKMPVSLISWMELTKTPKEVQQEIIYLMTNDIHGIDNTGFKPYLKDNKIYFNQRWLLIIGQKN